jgi:hypothetical protein
MRARVSRHPHDRQIKKLQLSAKLRGVQLRCRRAATEMQLPGNGFTTVHGALLAEIPMLADRLRETGYEIQGLHGGGKVRSVSGFEPRFEACVEAKNVDRWLPLARERISQREARRAGGTVGADAGGFPTSSKQLLRSGLRPPGSEDGSPARSPGCSGRRVKTKI